MAKKATTRKKRAPAKKKPATKKKEEAAPAKAAPAKEAPKQTYKKIRVNFWRTKLHGEELGIYQTLKYQAKTRYFAKNFEIEGIIEVDGAKKYIIAYNKDDWENKPDDKKRLILRIFTILEEKMGVGKGGNFKGGVELSMTHSLVQSYETKHPSPVFFIQLPRTVFFPRIVKGWRLKGTRWSFPLLPEKKEDQFQMVKARGTIGLGRDYDIYIGKKKIARVDMERAQKDVELEIYDEFYSKDKTFIMILTLFGAICPFMKQTENMVEKFFEPMKDTGTSPFKPPKQELDLFKNPRMMRR